MENEEIFKITFWTATIMMFVVALGIILFLQQIYHNVLPKINRGTQNNPPENISKPVIAPLSKEYDQSDITEQQESPNNLSGIKPVEPPITLSRQETKILLLSVQEYSSLDIADKMKISRKTVERHKENMMIKTSSKKFIGVIIYVLSNEILSIEDLKSL